jgi:hypothetical protein
MSSIRSAGTTDHESSSYTGANGIELADEPELTDHLWTTFKQGMFGVLVRSHALTFFDLVVLIFSFPLTQD